MPLLAKLTTANPAATSNGPSFGPNSSAWRGSRPTPKARYSSAKEEHASLRKAWPAVREAGE